MNGNADAELMFRKGMEDLDALESTVHLDAISDEIFGFHAQQAVEKFLKAWLWTLNVPPPKKHDLRLLRILVEEHGAQVTPPFERLMDLTDFATVFRYETCDIIEFDRQAILDGVQQCAEHTRKIVYG